ncbi:PspC domain-containing protein [Aerococcus agrisoli]|uniref:PspC domain-containing protein n=1 Tax=Aerococcus agrisoli TaxID=2487350 RepID=A0A3N4GT47_9LACT|nr:PspC domain-containing protein [Aerococcus agrisoli]RPA65485.1 PspC domain-containing protein [Aerococcus agrisoli]
MAKTLTKSNSNIMVDGVCAGIAEYFDIDPTIIRVLFVVISISGGAGILAYIILALIMPRASANRNDGGPRVRETKPFDDSEDINYNKKTKTNDTPNEEESWRDF